MPRGKKGKIITKLARNEGKDGTPQCVAERQEWEFGCS